MSGVDARPPPEIQRRYRRPLILGIAGSVLAESAIFVVFGLILHPAGSIVDKFLWTIVFCGLGMGSVVGVMLVLFVVDRLDGVAGVAATASISAVVLGGACNLLCLTLDSNVFHYFGGGDNPGVFIVNGVLLASLGGALVGWALFTPRGRAVLERIGI